MNMEDCPTHKTEVNPPYPWTCECPYPEFENPWGLTDAFYFCPECGAPVVMRGWWDDSPENGGACIGAQYKCLGEDTCEFWENE